MHKLMRRRELRLRGGGALRLDCSSQAAGDTVEVGANQAVQTSKRKPIITTVMAALLTPLGKRQHSAKKISRPNPYEGRGLDKFSMLKAELAAKREAAVGQIGASVSVVKVTAGSTTKWIPVVVSSNSCKTMAREGSSNSASTRIFSIDSVVPAEPSMETMPLQASSRTASSEEHAITDANTKISKSHVQERYASNDDNMIHRNLSDSNQKWVRFAKSGTFIAAMVGAFFIGKVVALAVTMTVALVFGLLLRKRHDSSVSGESRDRSTLRTQQQHEKDNPSVTSRIYDHREDQVVSRTANPGSGPVLEADNSIQTQITFAHQSNQPVKPRRNHQSNQPVKPRRNHHQKATFAVSSKRASSTKVVHSSSLSRETNQSMQTGVKGVNEKRIRFKSRFFRKRICTESSSTAPNSPSASGDTASYHCSSTPCTPVMKSGHPSATSFFQQDACDLDSKPLEEKRDQKPVCQTSRKLFQPQLPLNSLLRIEHRRHKSTSIPLQPSILSIGLVIVLGCLLSGLMLAILGLSCWWYAQSILKQLAGDTPSARCTSDPESTSQKRNASVFSDHVNNCKLDLSSIDYKKKVVMDGLLDRNLKLTT
eukprot:c25474_g1_i2 orf=1089-2873(+)